MPRAHQTLQRGVQALRPLVVSARLLLHELASQPADAVCCRRALVFRLTVSEDMLGIFLQPEDRAGLSEVPVTMTVALLASEGEPCTKTGLYEV